MTRHFGNAMRRWRLVLVVVLFCGCESAAVKCNRAKVASHEAWAAVAAGALEASIAINGDCFVYNGQQCRAFGGETGRALPYLSALRALHASAERASNSAARGALDVQDAAITARSASHFLTSATPRLQELAAKASSASDDQWTRCKDVAP